MNGKLSTREKVLVMFALCIGLGFLAFKFVIVPTLDTHSTTVARFAQLVADEQIMKLKISSEEIVKKTIIAKQLDYDEIKDIYPAPMTNESVDKLITGICLEYNIIPESLGMAAVKPVDLRATALPEQDAATVVKSIFTASSATITATGSYDDLMKLIDYAAATPYIHINLMSYSEPKEGNLAEAKPPIITLQFEVIMANTVIREKTAAEIAAEIAAAKAAAEAAAALADEATTAAK